MMSEVEERPRFVTAGYRGGGTGVNGLRNIFRLKLTENEERSALVG